MEQTAGSQTLAQLRASVAAAGDLTDREFDALMERVVDHRREVDVILGLIACHARNRSASRSGAARRAGFKTSAQYTAARIGCTVAEAQRLEELGEVLLGATGNGDDAGGAGGGDGPAGEGGGEDRSREKEREKPRGAAFPYLAEAVNARRVGPDAAALIKALLMRHPEALAAAGLTVADGVPETPLGRLPLAVVERATVDKCVRLPLRSVRSLIARLEADLTPPEKGAQDYEELRRRRSVTIREDRDGMVQIHALLDPPRLRRWSPRSVAT